MEDGTVPVVRPLVFTLRTVPLDLMALGGLAVVMFVFVPELKSFIRNARTVTSDSMTFSLLAMSCIFFFARISVALFSIVKGRNTNRVLMISCIPIVLSLTPHLLRVPLLIGWAHHCGYEVDHVIHDYRDTKFVFRKIGSPPDDTQSDDEEPDR